MKPFTCWRFKLLLFALGMLLTLWLLGFLAVAYRLTRRPQPPFLEPLPTADWGKFEPHRIKTADGEEIGAWLVVVAGDAASVLLGSGNEPDHLERCPGVNG